MKSRKELHERMERWATAVRAPQMGDPSRMTVEGYLKERLDAAYEGEWSEEVITTERAVARTFLEDKAYKRVIRCYFLGRLDPFEIANKYHTSEHGIRVLLDESLDRIEYHIEGLTQKA